MPQSSVTLENLTEHPIAVQLTLFREDSHVSRSQLQDVKKGKTIQGICGQKPFESLSRSSQKKHFWRMYQDCSVADTSARSLTIYPKQGIMQDGLLCQPPIVEHHTREKGCGFLHIPTPNTLDSMPPKSEKALTKEMTVARKGRSQPANLRDWIFWPTPDANEGMRGPAKTYNPRAKSQSGRTLTTFVNHFPTPTARDWKDNGSPADWNRHSPGLGTIVSKDGGQLNPQWVELLMGWPMNTTCLDSISHVLYLLWLMEMSDAKETRTEEVLRILQIGNVEKEIQGEIGRSVDVLEATFLLSLLCEYKNRPNQARIFLACAEILEVEMRGLQTSSPSPSAPYRPGYKEQHESEYPDTLQALSRLLAYFGPQAWKDGSWENAIPRVATQQKDRKHRLTALGNGQVPICVVRAFQILNNETINATIIGGE